MRYALVLFEFNPDPTRLQAWQQAVQIDLTKRSGVKGVRMINDAAYFCDLQHGLGALSVVIDHAQNHGVATKTLFFEDAPAFVHSDGKQVKI